MLLGLVALLLTQTAAPADPVKLASVGFTSVRVPKDLAASFEQTLALRLQETGLVRVTTQSDVASILGVERQRQLMGCTNESTNCIAELAGALGVEGVITGEIALVGKVYQLTVRILSARDASVLYQSLRRLKTEEDVLEELDRAAAEGAKKIHALLRVSKAPEAVSKPVPLDLPPSVVSQPSTGPSPRVGPWVVMGLGAALLVGGAVSQGLAFSDYQRLRDPSAPVTDLDGLASSGKLKQAIGLSGLGAGAVALGAGLLWYFLGRDPAPMTSLWISGDGAGLVLSGHY